MRRFSSDTGAENDDQLVGENGEILQGKQLCSLCKCCCSRQAVALLPVCQYVSGCMLENVGDELAQQRAAQRHRLYV